MYSYILCFTKTIQISYLNSTDSNGLTALCWAVYHNREAHVNILIKRGADLSLADHRGKAPIHYAAYLVSF